MDRRMMMSFVLGIAMGLSFSWGCETLAGESGSVGVLRGRFIAKVGRCATC